MTHEMNNMTHEMNNNDKTTQTPVADKLPKLNEKDQKMAESHDVIGWAFSLMGTYAPGDIHFDKETLLTIQKIDINTLRCLRLYDDAQSWWTLAMFKANFKAAGIEFQIDPYAQVTPVGRGPSGDGVGTDSQPRPDAAAPSPGRGQVASSRRSGEDDVGMEVV